MSFAEINLLNKKFSPSKMHNELLKLIVAAQSYNYLPVFCNYHRRPGFLNLYERKLSIQLIGRRHRYGVYLREKRKAFMKLLSKFQTLSNKLTNNDIKLVPANIQPNEIYIFRCRIKFSTSFRMSRSIRVNWSASM